MSGNPGGRPKAALVIQALATPEDAIAALANPRERVPTAMASAVPAPSPRASANWPRRSALADVAFVAYQPHAVAERRIPRHLDARRPGQSWHPSLWRLAIDRRAACARAEKNRTKWNLGHHAVAPIWGCPAGSLTRRQPRRYPAVPLGARKRDSASVRRVTPPKLAPRPVPWSSCT